MLGNGVWLSEGYVVCKEQSDSVVEICEEFKCSDVGFLIFGRGEFGLLDGGCGNDVVGVKIQECVVDYKLFEIES